LIEIDGIWFIVDEITEDGTVHIEKVWIDERAIDYREEYRAITLTDLKNRLEFLRENTDR
jgi:hypothetical protein